MKASLSACILTGTNEEIREIMRRLNTLPEYGLRDAVERIAQQIDAVERLEKEARAVRAEVSRKAMDLLSSVRQHWTDAEIAEATGYDRV